MPERALNGLRVPQASASGTVEELLRAWSTVKQYVWTVKRS
ncbi:MAG TPA: hypothetical protein VML57_12885 [Burkholderiales bacterium]|nr:hypothetical protein [Burkholderiales bacterium]